HDIGVRVHEDVLHEHLGALRVALGRVDEVALHVEDELVLRRPDLHARERLLERRVFGNLEDAAYAAGSGVRGVEREEGRSGAARRDRKSTRLNSSHGSISYAVFCLKKKKTIEQLM